MHKCKCSGEKSTSWGNTLLTHLFIQFTTALAISGGDVESKQFNDALQRITHLGDISNELTLANTVALAEGDDNSIPSDYYVKHYMQMAANYMGFSIKIDVHQQEGSTFCKFKAIKETNEDTATAKEFATSFFKHGLTTNKGLSANSKRECQLILAKLLILG